MKTGLAFLALGVVALGLQGAFATFLPAAWCPDLALLLVVFLGLRGEGAVAGLVLSALIGYASDLLSGSLLGQHALLSLVAFVTARLGSRQLNLRGAFPLAAFTAALTLGYGAGVVALSGFFTGRGSPDWSWFGELLQHAVVNAALVAPVMRALGEEEAGRRILRLEPRRARA
jgi:rod shape-determining protein MreD